MPWAVVAVIPIVRSRYRPLVGFPRGPGWLPGYDQLTYRRGEQVGWQVFRAVRRVGLRAILHAGWAGLGGQLPPEIFSLQYAPYGWLFPWMAGIVHHGGSGTTGFALRSGVPSLVVPFAFDQPYWGERTAALGAGPPPLPYQELEAGRLTAAMGRLVSEPALQAGACGDRAKTRGRGRG